MAEPHQHRREGDPEGQYVSSERAKPSAWSDPRTWMTLFGLMLTVCGLLLTATIWIASRMLEEIKSVNNNIANLTLTTSNSFTSQGSDIRHLTEEQSQTRASLRDQNAYNFNMHGAVVEMATTLKMRGIPAPAIPDPPKLGGQ